MLAEYTLAGVAKTRTTEEPQLHKKFSFRRANARRAMSVEILSAAAHPYEKSHFKRLAVGE